MKSCSFTLVAADERMRAAYDRDGLDGALALLKAIRSDYAAAYHFQSFLALGDLTDAEINAALDHLGRSLTDDQQRTSLLHAASALYNERPGIRASYLACVERFASVEARSRFTHTVFGREQLGAGEIPEAVLKGSGC